MKLPDLSRFRRMILLLIPLITLLLPQAALAHDMNKGRINVTLTAFVTATNKPPLAEATAYRCPTAQLSLEVARWWRVARWPNRECLGKSPHQHTHDPIAARSRARSGRLSGRCFGDAAAERVGPLSR